MKRIFAVLLAGLLLLPGCAAKKTAVRHDPDRMVIALLDSGVSATALESSHLLAGYNYITGTAETEDSINHGTAVASTILGCTRAKVTGGAPTAYLVPLVIVTKKDGKIVSATPEQLAKAIRDSIDVYRVDIINVSLGIQTDHPVIREAVAYADQKGIPVISAVGNDGETGKPYYPAAYETVLAVGSCDKQGNASSFSQSGAGVLAPGEDLLLAARDGSPYGTKGTSFAAGFVSAYAARVLMKNPDITPQRLFDNLKQKALSCGGYLPREATP